MFNYTGCVSHVKKYLQADMPFGPVVPDIQIGPPMRPSYHKCAQGILIIDIHAVFFHASLTCSIVCGPTGQMFASLWITKCYGIQCFGCAKIWNRHLMHEVGDCAGHVFNYANLGIITCLVAESRTQCLQLMRLASKPFLSSA